MTTQTLAAPRLTSVAAHPRSPVGEHYVAGRLRGALAPGFARHPGLNLHRYPGMTIEHLTFTNVYLGGRAAWQTDDVEKIDWALAAAVRDPHLNNVIAQYTDGSPTTVFKPSRILERPLHRVYRAAISGFVAEVDRAGGLSGFDLGSTVFNFLLPRGVLLSDRPWAAHRQRHEVDDEEPPSFKPAVADYDTADSTHGLGGYHGSIHPKHGGKKTTVYYAVGVYSEGSNGIVAFDERWKNVCATFYHELCAARTDPDIEDAIAAGDAPQGDAFLGWYSPKGGEIGDKPMDEAGVDLRKVMEEVRLTRGDGRVPIQLMWSNAVGGPEGPNAKKHAPQEEN